MQVGFIKPISILAIIKLQLQRSCSLLHASFHMELEALIWFQEAEEASVFTNWDSLV